jgi:hypothetical protein
MDIIQSSMASRHVSAFSRSLTLDDIRRMAPAVFAKEPDERTSETYTLIPTERVLVGLMQAGFIPVDARQTRARRSVEHARHMVRLRRRFETIQLRDSIPEVVFLNSHDGTSAYQLRVGLYRVVCTNGLIVSVGGFPSIRVAHRGDIVDEVVTGALEMTERFEFLAGQVERMEQRVLDYEEQLGLAEQAMALRYPEPAQSGMSASKLLTTRRPEDLDNSLWTILNRVQENLLRGGLSRHSASGRLLRTRRITSIREDVRLNSGLWDLASAALAA